ncbi:MAG: formate dehydrogenase accessory protein FdhE [Acidimicrobiia bacterium]
MIGKRTGGPSDFVGRLARLRQIDWQSVGLDAFGFYEAVLSYQAQRSTCPEVTEAVERLASTEESGFSFSAESEIDALLLEVQAAISQLAEAAPGVLAEKGRDLVDEPDQLAAGLGSWLERESVGAPASMWFQLASAPIFEALARSRNGSEEWTKATCPVCRGLPQVSAIVEESGEFMHGAPRYLICSRCAYWWRFTRAVCPSCGEHDPKRLSTFRADAWPWARLDSCESCRSYIKMFDLREPGGIAVVPLVDDLTTLSLDLWAQTQDLRRAAPTFVGI